MYSLSMVIIVLLVASRAACQTPRYETEATLDESKRKAGSERLQEYRQYAQTSPCWHQALLTLESSCRAMSDEEQTRIALSFANCHFERSGRQTYPCPPDSNVGACTSKERMGDLAFQVYTEFFTHANHMCYFLQSQLWQERTEGTINKLSLTSSQTVKKLEKSLEYHKLLESKQTAALENQAAILAQDQKLSQSLEKTHTNMNQMFQEMFEKAESHKQLLSDVFGSLSKGLSGIQWLLSSILGEIMSLETAVFFTITFLIISFLPQFGLSRAWLYLILLTYGLVEGVVRRCVFWMIDPQLKDPMPLLHTTLWYSRWTAIVVIALFYMWRCLIYSNAQVKQLKLLESIQRQLSLLREEQPKSSHFSQVKDELFIGEEIEINESTSPSPDATISINELYKRENRDGHIVTGTQLLDFLSGIYIKRNTNELVDNSDSLSEDDDYTFNPTTEELLDTVQTVSIADHQQDLQTASHNDSGVSDVSGYNLRSRKSYSKITSPYRY